MNRAEEKLVRGFLGMNGGNEGEDPTYFGFTLNFWMYETQYNSGYHRAPNNTVISSLLLDEKSKDAASNYLFAIKDITRCTYLKEFIKITNELQTKKPWYFQSISGLNELLKPFPDGSNTRKDKILTIECLESVDNIMHYWADLYRYATYDKIWRRNMLPINKRRFGMEIIVGEFRNMKTISSLFDESSGMDISRKPPSYEERIAEENTQNTKDWQFEDDGGDTFWNSMKKGYNNGLESAYDTVNSEVEKQKDVARGFGFFGGPKNIKQISEENEAKIKLSSIMSNMTFHTFRLYDCEFIFEDFPSFDTITNTTAGEPVKFVFKIKVGDVEENKQYGLKYGIFDDVSIESMFDIDQDGYKTYRTPYEFLTHPLDEKKAKDNNSDKKQGWGDILGSYAKSLAQDAVAGAMDYVTQEATGYATEFVSGYTSKLDQIRQKAAKGDWSGAYDSAKGLFSKMTGKPELPKSPFTSQRGDPRNTQLKREQDTSYEKVKNKYHT